MPEETNPDLGGTSPGGPEATSTLAQDTQAGAAGSGSSPGVASDPGVSASSGAGGTGGVADSGSLGSSQQAAQSVRDQLRQFGLGQVADHFQDDGAALGYLAQQYAAAQQAQSLLPYAQRYLQHAGQFERWISEQQAAQQQAAQQQPPKFWNPPEFNQSWESMLQVDDQGNIVPKPGTPPDVLPKYLAYRQYQRDFSQKFLSDPEAALRPLIEQVAQEKAQELVQGNLGAYQEQVYAQTFVQQHSNWLHQRDGAGNVVRDPITGQPVLSPYGQRFRDYVLEAESLGLRGSAAQQRYATNMLRADVLALQAQAGAQQGAAANLNDQKKQQFLKRPNRGGSVTTSPNLNGSDPEQDDDLPLGEKLRRAFNAEGIDDRNLILGGA